MESFELIDNFFQIVVLLCAAAAAGIFALRRRSRDLLILSLAYACLAMGTIYYVLYLVMVKGERLLEVAQAVAQKDERVDAVRLGGQNVFDGQTAVVAVAQNQKFRHGKRILLKFYSGSRCWMVSSALYTSLLE